MQRRVLRLALVSGVLVFGAVAWFLRRSGGAPEPSGEATAIYGGVVFLLAGTAFWYQLGVGFMVLAFLAFPGEPPR